MIEFRIKEKTRSLNESFRGDWRPRAAVAKRQRTKAMQACPKWPGGPLLVVRLTRVSPGTLDGDAVPAALKHIRDGVASRLKIDDASPLVGWEYHQAKGEAEVVVQIWVAGEDAPPLPVGRLTKMKPASDMNGGRSRVAQKRLAAGSSVHAAYTPPPMGMGHAVDRLVRMTPAEERKVAAALKSAKEADETFAPAPDAPDMTDALGPGPHPEHYDCPCAPCVGRWST